MKKELKKIYICSNCDSQFPKWQGQCPECGKWSSIKESGEGGGSIEIVSSASQKEQIKKLKTGLSEIENVLGGGITPGSLILLAGDPGIGKSTLVLQIIDGFAKENKKDILYVCGEESPGQIQDRAARLDLNQKPFSFLPATEIEDIFLSVKKNKPSLVVIDSIQTISSGQVEGEIGNVNQIRAVTAQLMQLAKKENITIIVIGHVTKEGVVAGPRVLEHMVDVVLYLEGDDIHEHRLLRSVKNRFGPTNQVGVFIMTETGLEEVKNPSQIFLQEQSSQTPGSLVSVIMEGVRPFLIEIQALTNKTSYGYPRRASSGFDLKRLELVLAVLERRGGLKLGNQDVFLNIAGGLKSKDPALDLAAALAIASSLSNQAMPERSIVLGELGLGGEVRPVSHFANRVSEAKRLGFKIFYTPIQKEKNIQAKQIKNLSQGLEILGINK